MSGDDLTWIARMLVVLSAVALFLVALVAVNQSVISLRFLSWQTPEWSVFWWLLLAFLIGLVLGLLGIVVLGAKQSLKNRQLRKDLELANRELHRLRNLSLHD